MKACPGKSFAFAEILKQAHEIDFVLQGQGQYSTVAHQLKYGVHYFRIFETKAQLDV
jgi:hypothetical protein